MGMIRALAFLAALLWGSSAFAQADVASSCAAVNLTPGTTHYLVVDPTGGLCSFGGGAGACNQATTYLARTTGGNEGGNAAPITALICGLVADGVWAKLDALYVLAQQNQADARLNLISASYPLVGTPPFTAYQGFYNFVTAASFLDTGFNSTTAVGAHYTQNSASFSTWDYSVTVSGTGPTIGSGATSHMFPEFAGGVFYARVNNGSAGSVTTTITHGLFVGDRPDASNIYPYQNGVSTGGPLAFASQTPDNANFTIGGYSGSGTNDMLSAVHIGASLGAAGQLALYNRLRTYLSAVGVP
jgi:hypothetical protein